ncbi:MAG: hypothetical protein ACYCS7_13140 [Acidimicrobiales bacterium]
MAFFAPATVDPETGTAVWPDGAYLAPHVRHAGTLARMLVHAGLSGNMPAPGSENARTALDRLVARSHQRASADVVGLVADARVALEARR